MRILIRDSYEEVSQAAAQIVSTLIRNKPNCTLGLATGSTTLGLYKELIRMHKEEGLDFSKVVTFNPDEYISLPPGHNQSYRYFMNEDFFKHININTANVYIPDGITEDIEKHCAWYESEIERHGGIDLQIPGIGSNGHIAFNESGTSLGSGCNCPDAQECNRSIR
ncbi:glucosamine-6-phosphate deaminase [candidate division KSB1 bacterium]